MKTEMLSYHNQQPSRDHLAEAQPELLGDLHDAAQQTEDTLVSEFRQRINEYSNEGISNHGHEQTNSPDLPFRPDTVLRFGSTALDAATAPDLHRIEVTGGAMSQPNRSRSGTIYAQDNPEYQPYVEHARQLVYNLAAGDSSGLSSLPSQFSGALSTRMKQRIAEVESGEMAAADFRIEINKMISVACIGLGKASAKTIE